MGNKPRPTPAEWLEFIHSYVFQPPVVTHARMFRKGLKEFGFPLRVNYDRSSSCLFSRDTTAFTRTAVISSSCLVQWQMPELSWNFYVKTTGLINRCAFVRIHALWGVSRGEKQAESEYMIPCNMELTAKVQKRTIFSNRLFPFFRRGRFLFYSLCFHLRRMCSLPLPFPPNLLLLATSPPLPGTFLEWVGNCCKLICTLS